MKLAKAGLHRLFLLLEILSLIEGEEAARVFLITPLSPLWLSFLQILVLAGF
jgi:hypothetical protein